MGIDLSQGMPTNVDAERFVLGSILLDEAVLHVVRPLLSPEEFSLEKHRRIWRRACELYDGGGHVDRITIANALMNFHELESCDGLSYLVELDDGLPQIPNVDSYVQIVKDKAVLRKIIVATQHLQNRCMEAEESPQQILDSIGPSLLDLVPQEAGHGLISAKDLAESVGITELLSPRKESGIPFKWRWMTEASCGMGPEELWVLAGGTSAGKTAAAIEQAVYVARRGFSVPIFSMEVGNKAVFRRAVIHMAHVDKERVDRGICNREEREQLRNAANELIGLPVYFDDSGAQTCACIHAALRRLKLKSQIGMIIVDYLQLLGSSARYGSRAEEVGANARALKLAAKDFQCPVLLLSQFNRDPGKENRRPSLFDLKESGDIENHANGVWFIYRPANAEVSNRDTVDERVAVEFMLPKQRDGARDIAQPFYFFPRYQFFGAVDTRFEGTGGEG